jgi:hypothetical protein
MPTYYARKAGNINATDVWATTPSGTASAVTFAAGDVLVANSFAIAINVDTNLGASGQVRNDTLGGATVGGTFTLNAGVTLTANVLHNTATGGATVVTFAASAPNVAYIVGNVSSPLNTSGGVTPINISSNGTLFFTGNATGDLKSVLGGAGGAIQIASGGTLNFTGNATGGGGAAGYAIYNSTTGNVNITGNCQGAVAPAVANNSTTGIVTINGQAIGSTTTGGGAGVINLSTGGVTVKRAIGGSYGPGSTGVSAAPGVSNSALGVVSVEELEYGTNGMSPTSGGGIRLKKANTNVAVFNFCDTAGAKTLIDATANASMPAAADVRSGLSYASGALTGTCAVPAAGSVSLGVPVDAGFGTAVLTPEAVWGHASRTITEGGITAADVWSAATRTITGGTVTTLTNAPTVPSAASIRAEIDSNSTQLAAIKAKTDNLPASPAATGDIPTAAQNATAVWSKPANELTVADSIGERAKQQSTVAITGAQLAAALS